MSWSRDIPKGCFMGGTFSIILRYKKGKCNFHLTWNKHENISGISKHATSRIDSSSLDTTIAIIAKPFHISCSPASGAKRGHISLKKSVCTLVHIHTCRHTGVWFLVSILWFSCSKENAVAPLHSFDALQGTSITCFIAMGVEKLDCKSHWSESQ